VRYLPCPLLSDLDGTDDSAYSWTRNSGACTKPLAR
jgi:hypothetical protein